MVDILGPEGFLATRIVDYELSKLEIAIMYLQPRF